MTQTNPSAPKSSPKVVAAKHASAAAGARVGAKAVGKNASVGNPATKGKNAKQPVKTSVSTRPIV